MVAKTELTLEEEALIKVVQKEYIDLQTQQQPVEDIELAVATIWEMMDYPKPKVIIEDSPISCKKACPDTNNFAFYWSLWYCSYAAMYDFANRIGVEMDQDKLNKFLLWTRCCPFVLFNEDTVYVSRKPVELHFDDERRLHNEEGMSCRFEDDWGIWTVNGVAVDEQIVMKPETQTLKQIRNEQNEEVKRIRIERYGWAKYLTEIEAVKVHERTNDIEFTKEFLFRSDSDNMTVLLCICPSTGKEFSLEVPPDTKTCEAAQSWLSSGLSDRIISAS